MPADPPSNAYHAHLPAGYTVGIPPESGWYAYAARLGGGTWVVYAQPVYWSVVPQGHGWYRTGGEARYPCQDEHTSALTFADADYIAWKRVEGSDAR